jgi:hypothetical protein
VVQDAFREHEKFIQQKQLLDTLQTLVRSCPAIFGHEGDEGSEGNEIISENVLHQVPAEPVN